MIISKDIHQESEARNRLKAAALELFTKKGFAATSVREIVTSAGVTKPVLYYYFRNKEGLYLELLEGPFEKFDALLAAYPERERKISDQLTSLCEDVFDLILENLDTARLMYSIYYGPPQGAPFFDFDDYHIKLQEKVRVLLRKGIVSGELRDLNLEDVMWLIIGALNVAMEEQLCRKKPGIDLPGLRRLLSLILGACRT